MPAKVDKFKAQSAKRKTKAQNLEFLVLNFSFALYALSFTLTCYAAPSYGTKLSAKKQFFIGAQTHSIFKRYLEDEYGKIRSIQHFLLLSYGIFDWLSIDLKGGSGNIKQHPVGSDEVDYTSNFAGGYGFRLRFYNRKNIKMVFGFQHISVHPKSTHLGDNRNEAILDDWQASILWSYDFNKLRSPTSLANSGLFLAKFQWLGKFYTFLYHKKITTYFGTRWSRIDYIHKINVDRKRKMSDLTKQIGFIFGFDLPLTKNFWFNLEGSAFDSEALAFSLNYSF